MVNKTSGEGVKIDKPDRENLLDAINHVTSVTDEHLFHDGEHGGGEQVETGMQGHLIYVHFLMYFTSSSSRIVGFHDGFHENSGPDIKIKNLHRRAIL
jgi:hypothetical protein